MANDHLAHLSYLCADSRGGIAERQDGHVLRPVQPVYCHLGAGCPFHHGYVVVPANTDIRKPNHSTDILTNCHVAEAGCFRQMVWERSRVIKNAAS